MTTMIAVVVYYYYYITSGCMNFWLNGSKGNSHHDVIVSVVQINCAPLPLELIASFHAMLIHLYSIF